VTRWRLAAALGLAVVVGLPLAWPLLDLAGRPRAWQAWAEADRLMALARNTALFVAGTVALALPLGTAGAVLLYRTDLPGRRFFRFVTILTLFVPLPLFAAAWQAALGSGGWLPLAVWGRQPAQPWGEGLPAAVWVQAQAALPWVILLVGRALYCVEGELEEDALLAAGPWRVLWHVTLPRAGAAVVAAGLWVALQSAGEITVTSLMQVRTFAEEAFTQFSRGGPEGQARAVAAALPLILLTVLVLVLAVPRLQRALPPPQSTMVHPVLFPLGWARWPFFVAVLLAVGLLVGVPVLSLTWQAGLHGTPLTWSAAAVAEQVVRAAQLSGKVIGLSLAWAALAGALAAGSALLLCWLAAESRWLQAGVLGVLAVAWSLPGPVAGYGLKEVIGMLVDWSPRGPAAQLLYYRPTPLPVLWAHLVRFLPYAVAVLWPVVRLVPRELIDASRVDGAPPARELFGLVVPLTAPALLTAALVAAALSLSEISASKPVSIPGTDTFTQVLFDRMHYGVPGDVAGPCLVLLLVLAVAGALAAMGSAVLSRILRG
jgi:iron(III) transport system permease protein